MVTLQHLILKLSEFWASRGCLLQQPLDIEVGAGTMHPETFLRVLGPDALERRLRAAVAAAGRRPLRREPEPPVQAPPVPGDPQAGARRSAAALSRRASRRAASTRAQHDIRFEEDNWESPTLGAWGIGWQVLFDGHGDHAVHLLPAGRRHRPVADLRASSPTASSASRWRCSDVDNVFDLEWAPGVKYRDVRLATRSSSRSTRSARSTCRRRSSRASPRPVRPVLRARRRRCCESDLVLPALEHCLKCSHLFNILDASGSIGVTERTAYILRVRQLAVGDREGVRGREPAARSRGASEAASVMDRELLLEIGCEELPASWLPGLTEQLGERARRAAEGAAPAARSAGRDLQHAAAADRPRRARSPSGRRISKSWSPGRRCRPAFRPDGTADAGGARLRDEAGRRGRGARARRDAEGRVPRVPQASARQERGRRAAGRAARHAARPDVSRSRCTGTRCSTTAGASCCSAGRSAGCCSCTAAASCRSRSAARRAPQGRTVQDVESGAVTYGHRFLTTSGRAGRAIKVRSVRRVPGAAARELRRPRARASAAIAIARELDVAGAAPRRPRAAAWSATVGAARGSAGSRRVSRRSSPGTFASEFLELPEEVLTTTLIHHQHYFPVVDDDGKLKEAFLAVVNTRAGRRADDRARTPSAWSRRGCATRSSSGTRIARRRSSRGSSGSTRCCSTRSSAATATRPSASSSWRAWIAGERASGGRTRRDARRDGRRGWPRRISPPTWCASSPSCRARWAASTRARKGCPRQVWKAIYYHYLPIGVEADAPPSRAQLGDGGGDVGGGVARRQARHGRRACRMAGERPTGSRDPFGLRRQMHGHRQDPDGSAGADRHRSRGRLARCSRDRAARGDAAGGRDAWDGEARRSRSRTSACASCSSSAGSRSTSCAARRPASGDVVPLRARRVAEALQALRGVGGLPGARGAVQAGQEHRAGARRPAPRSIARR